MTTTALSTPATVSRRGLPPASRQSIVYPESDGSPDDLMATKLKVLLQRVEAKDYQDIAALIKTGVSLEKGLAAARAMYGYNFQPSESLKALVYFQGGDLDSLLRPERETLIKAVKTVRKLPTVKIVAHRLSRHCAGFH